MSEMSYAPPAIHPMVGQLTTAFAARDISLAFDLGRIQVRLVPVAMVPPGPGNLSPGLVLELGQAHWSLYMAETRSFYELLALADGEGALEGIALADLPWEISVALAEAYLGQGLALLEGALGTPVALAAGTPEDVPEGDLESGSDPADGAGEFIWPFDLIFTGDDGVERRTRFGLGIPWAHGPWVMDLLKQFPRKVRPTAILDGLPRTLGFQLGQFQLDPAGMAGLETGDILLPDIWYPGQGKIVLALAPHEYLCDLVPEGLCLTRSLTPNWEEKSMNDENTTLEESGAESAPVITDPNALALNLVFELGRTPTTLGEVRKLMPGQVLTLPRPLEEGVTVDIRANGQCIGRGRIVDVAGETGIQILDMGE
ncbi:MAG: FliM/FliN family flagellar motor switch protein [Desulfobacterales bacterium]|nr:FliM/FliN family flagellar motor switch protein [Desulfobacterales bacterium]